jgi:hypothetical protein
MAPETITPAPTLRTSSDSEWTSLLKETNHDCRAFELEGDSGDG